MHLPRISVVTPSFNQGDFIEETIDSVLSQNYPNLEYIIIDGGSTDRSVEIIKKYEKHLKYWVSERDNGHAHAINKGFAQSTGEIMSWLNSDDKYYPWTFRAVAEAFQLDEKIEWLQGVQSWFNAKGMQTHAKPAYRNVFDFVTGNHRWIQQESVFWKRSLWEKAGGKLNEEYRFMVDGELWSRFFRFAEMYQLDVVVGGLRQHETRRALNNETAVTKEMNTCVADLMDSFDPATKSVLQEMLSIIRAGKECGTSQKLMPGFLSGRIQNRKRADLIAALRPDIENQLGPRFSGYNIIRSAGDTFTIERKPVNLQMILSA